MTTHATTASPIKATTRVTRGTRHKQARKERRSKRIPKDALIIGVDLARENQAICFMHHEKVLGRISCQLAPMQFETIFEAADSVCQKHHLTQQVWAMEPTGHYWMLLAEQCERHGRDYVLIHPLSVARQRETENFNREKSDPRDAELIATLATQGRIIDTVLPSTAERAALQDLAYAYFSVRSLSASAKTALYNFWHRLLPEFFDHLKNVDGLTALAIGRALVPFSQLSQWTKAQWLEKVKALVPKQRILRSRVMAIYDAILLAAADPHRRSGEGMPWRIRHAAERRVLLQTQKQELRDLILEHYRATEESLYLDSIAGSDPLYNALTLGLIGDFQAYDHPRTLVKLAGTEINMFTSGDSVKNSRISHRGRRRLRAAAYLQARYLVKRNTCYAQRFISLRKTKKLREIQCYVAIANSYLRTAHALVTQKKFYSSPQ